MTDSQNEPTPHRFDLPIRCPLTTRERIKLEYASQFIPYLKFLEKSWGREKVLQSLEEFPSQGIKDFAEEVVREKGKNDLSVFKEIFSQQNPNLMEVLTPEVIEDTPQSLTIKVTECALAEVFRKAGAAEYGSAALCRDVLFTRLVNPQISLELSETLMQGNSYCLYRWRVEHNEA